MKSSYLCNTPTDNACLEHVMNSFSLGPSFSPVAIGFLVAADCAFLLFVLIASYKSWSKKKIEISDFIDRIIMGLLMFCVVLIFIFVL